MTLYPASLLAPAKPALGTTQAHVTPVPCPSQHSCRRGFQHSDVPARPAAAAGRSRPGRQDAGCARGTGRAAPHVPGLLHPGAGSPSIQTLIWPKAGAGFPTCHSQVSTIAFFPHLPSLNSYPTYLMQIFYTGCRDVLSCIS